MRRKFSRRGAPDDHPDAPMTKPVSERRRFAALPPVGVGGLVLGLLLLLLRALVVVAAVQQRPAVAAAVIVAVDVLVVHGAREAGGEDGADRLELLRVVVRERRLGVAEHHDRR